jgi:hypothetical protein
MGQYQTYVVADANSCSVPRADFARRPRPAVNLVPLIAAKLPLIEKYLSQMGYRVGL